MATAIQEILPTSDGMNEIELTVLDNMRLVLYPAEIARAGEHHSAYFRITRQPTNLDPLPCRAEILTGDGKKFHVLVQNGTFQLTNDITQHGTGSLQLVYSDGTVSHKTQIAQYWVAPSVDAVDPSAPDYQDGLAVLTAKAFAEANLQEASLIFRNIAGLEVDRVPLPGSVEDLDRLYLRTDGANRMVGSVTIEGINRGLLLDYGASQPALYTTGALLILRRPAGNAEVQIEDNGGDPASRSNVLTERSADLRYLTTAGGDQRYVPATGGIMTGPIQAVGLPPPTPLNLVTAEWVGQQIAALPPSGITQPEADVRYVQRSGGTGSSMSGNLVINGVVNGVQFITTAFIYAPAAGIVLRRGLGGNNIYSEASSGDTATRRRLLTEDDIAPSLNLLMVADVPLTATFQNVFSVAYPIPRGGNSRVQVTITGGLRAAQISSLGMVQVNCTPGTQVQNVFTYTVDSGGGIPVCNGFSITFDVDVTGTSPMVAAQIRNLTTTTLVLVGGNSDPERTLVTISDLGAR